jgi:PAS domain S-box-containing protein
MAQIFSSYSTKLLTLTLLISIIPIVFFGSYMYVDKIYKEIDLTKNQLITSSEHNAKQIARWIDERKINVNDISKNPLLISATKKLIENKFDENELFAARVSLEKQLNVAHQNHYTWLHDLRISDPQNGDVLFYTSLSKPKYNLKYQNHFIEAIAGKTSPSEIYHSLDIIKNEYGDFEKGVPTMLISTPIQGEVGIIAVLTARIDVFEITNNSISPTAENFVSGDSYLINSNGVLLSKPNSFSKLLDLQLFDKRPELELSVNKLLPYDYFNKIGNSEYIEIGWNEGYDNLLGEKVVGIIVPVDNIDWYYLTEISHNEAFYDVTFFQSVLLALIGITILSVTGVSLFYSAKLTDPIKNLIKVTQQISQGNLKVSVKSGGNDEINDLAASINSMALSLQKAKESERAILNKFKDLYERSPSLNRTIDLDGKIIDCNKSYADSFGYRKDEIIGKSIYDFVPKNNRDDLKDSFETWKKTGMVNSREIIFQRKDGSLFPGIVSATNLYDEQGKLLGSNTIIQDLSAIRNAQKEIQELQTKRLSVIGELTARIAHDMRNPLSIIKNSAELIKMKQKNMNKQTLEQWNRLDRGIYRIAHQVDDVLDYVRKPIIKKRNNKFSVILRDALERCDIPDNIKISMPKNDGSFFCDPNRLEIVLVNLLMNAVQALNTQKGTISISFTENYQGRNSMIQISDTGPGIPLELINKIFDPLFTTRQIGTGLGLPSCKNIIEYHRGTIDVKSTEGKGTTFIIQLPTMTEWEQISKIGDKEKLTEFITSLQSNL